MHNLSKAQQQVLSTWESATPKQRTLVLIAGAVCTAIGITFLIYSPRIFDAIAPLAEKWRALPGGWIILFLLICLTAFPPVIGYSTCLTIAGFVWGMKGWFIAASANVVGSLLSFIASRTVLSHYVHSLVGQDKRFTAFALTLKHDGIKILIMIRLCPLPYSLSNAALSTFPTVNVFNFVMATAAATPKLLIHVFVGSRLAAIAESGEKMDLGTKLINYFSIIAFGILGAVVGYLIYEKTMERARQIEEEEEAHLVEEGGVDGYSEEYSERQSGDTDGWGEDDVSLWDNDEPALFSPEAYRDGWDSDDREEPVAGNGKRQTIPPRK